MTGRPVSGLLVSADDCRELLGLLLPLAKEAHLRGQVARAEALTAVLQALRQVVGQGRPPVLRSELQLGASDLLGTGSDQWYSPAEAAQRTGLSRQTISRMARTCALDARRIGRGWAIRRGAVEELVETRKARAA